MNTLPILTRVKQLLPVAGLLIFLCSFFSGSVQGQNNMNKEVNVVRPYSPTISDAFKLRFMPKIEDTLKTDVRFDYAINPVRWNPALRIRTLDAIGLRQHKENNLKNTQIRLGFGNYWTPYGQVDIHTLKNPKAALGVNMKHISSQGRVRMADGQKVYAGYAENNVRLYGERINRSSTLTTNFWFNEDHHYLYGYNTDTLSDGSLVTPLNRRPTQKSSMSKRQYILLGSKFSWQSNEKSRNGWQYRLDGQYDFMLDDQRDYEHQGQTDFAFSRDLRQISFGSEMGADYFYRPLLTDTLNYVVARLDPWIGFRWKYIKLQAGPKVAMDRNASQFFFYPRMKLEINITNLLVPYMGLDGYYENHSYRTLSRENPYLVVQPDILPTNHRFIAYGGLRGRFTPLVAFDLAVSWEDAQNLYFFVTDTSGSVHHTFLPVYDNGSILKINGEVSLRQSENLSFILKGHYYQYQLDVLPAAWHRSNWDANLTTRYAWRNKLFVQVDLFLLGPYPVPEVDPAKGTIAQMDGLIDLSLGAEYRFTPFISAFCQANNLLSDEYYLWQNYPMQKINFIGGLTLIF